MPTMTLAPLFPASSAALRSFFLLRASISFCLAGNPSASSNATTTNDPVPVAQASMWGRICSHRREWKFSGGVIAVYGGLVLSLISSSLCPSFLILRRSGDVGGADFAYLLLYSLWKSSARPWLVSCTFARPQLCLRCVGRRRHRQPLGPRQR